MDPPVWPSWSSGPQTSCFTWPTCEKIRGRVQYKPAITHSSRRLSRVCGSQDHIITGQVKWPQEVSSWLYCSDHVAQGVLKTSKDGDHTASVGNLPACTHGEKKKIFLLNSSKLPCFHLWPLSFIFSPCTTVKSPTPSPWWPLLGSGRQWYY